MIMNSKELLKKYSFSEIIKFMIVGISNFAVSLVAFKCLITYTSIHYLVCSVLSYLLGIFNAFIWNSFFVFRKKIKIIYGIKFLFVYLSSMLLNMIILFIFVDFFLLNQIQSQIMATILVMIYNYFSVKCWVYKKEKI